jgi:LuxR family transcriptional regulator, maltose regulon positive regulatory protein
VSEPLLRSKLVLPPLPQALVERERLRAALDRGALGPVTLLDAPAGWGKTVALSAWARAGDGPPVGWLSLEAGDEGTRFWRYLHAALASAGVRVDPEGPELLPRLADGLARQAEPVVLVLDDLHQVRDPDVLSGLDFLLRHGGEQLRLVVAARTEPGLPLHRWRLRGELTELGVRELSFTSDETAAALARYGLTVPAAQAAELHARTEGWPAGVRLAALGLAEAPDPAPVPPLFGVDPRIAGYLFEEVLAGQPAVLRDGLLATSVLDRMCAGLVEAVTGARDGERFLAELRRTNAFVLPLPGAAPTRWYRYHRIFGELLRAELHRTAANRAPELHRRAATWFAAYELPADALRHALAGQDWQLATSVLTQHWPHLVRYGRGQPAATQVPPPPAEAVHADPELALAYAAERLDRHDLAGADGYLDLADRHEHLLTPQRRYRHMTIGATLRLAAAQHRSDLDGARCAAKHLLDLAGAGGRPDERAAVLARTGAGTAELAAGELEAAEDALRAGLAGAERTGLAAARVVCASGLAFVLATRGELRAAERTARLAVRLPPGPGQPVPAYAAYAYLALATVAMHWDRLEDAQANLNLAAGLCTEAGPPALGAALTVARAHLLRERGDLTGGYEALRTGRLRLGEWPLSGHLADRFAAAEADLRTARGDTATVRRLLDGDRGGGSPFLALALARAYLRDGNPAAATQALPPWVDGGTREVLPVRLDAGLVEALAARRLGEDRRATRALERVLQLAEPEGYRRVFTGAGTPVRDLLIAHLDSGTAYWSLVSDLIAATGTAPEPDPTGPAAPGEPLTERERTVLRYLQSILSNVEIASELSLSVNTVKTHVRNIYRKLAATGRRDAIRKARELRLL